MHEFKELLINDFYAIRDSSGRLTSVDNTQARKSNQ